HIRSSRPLTQTTHCISNLLLGTLSAMSTPTISYSSIDHELRAVGLRILRVKSTKPRQVSHRRLIMFDDYFTESPILTIGRTRQCHIRLRDRAVSRLHCIVEKIDDAYFVFEYNAKNGLFVTECGDYDRYRPVKWQKVQLGMNLRIGRYFLVPINQDRVCPIVARRNSEFLRIAHEIYGPQDARRHVGASTKKAYRRYLESALKKIKGK
ncbi:MAG: FHA domain-containing protein, partial [Myxococcota bacterium]